MRLSFFGATETVTGSKFLVEAGGARVLVDCGLFQGVKSDRLRNREPLPFDAASLDGVVLTHAHLDHSGLVPLLVKAGFRGNVWCTRGTCDLLRVLWPDAARLQEEQAKQANAEGWSKHHPAQPLYTVADAAAALRRLVPTEVDRPYDVGGATVRWTPAGHIIGAASVHLEAGSRSILFSGDVGRPSDPFMQPPRTPPPADWLVVESTYGGRRHPGADVREELAQIVRRTVSRGGAVLVPAFAVGRAQTMLHLISMLRLEGRIPDVPVFLDSPMAVEATQIYLENTDDHRLSAEACDAIRRMVHPVSRAAESRAIAASAGPRIVISASGMATGGRVLHHLTMALPEPHHTVVLVGHQAAGTRGEALASGAPSVKIHGRYVPVRAEIVRLDGLSAHADGEELLAWLATLERAPERAFVVHGEPARADAMRLALADRLGWRATVPRYGETFDSRAPTARAAVVASRNGGAELREHDVRSR
ncbi:MAG: MBL fold metallo-hydrolase [Myxococcota bacterium]|nr:MBL fold metallo-hydrolase [Myxococcota bacterium]